jgi:hypothetical protein
MSSLPRLASLLVGKFTRGAEEDQCVRRAHGQPLGKRCAARDLAISASGTTAVAAQSALPRHRVEGVAFARGTATADVRAPRAIGGRVSAHLHVASREYQC